MAAGDDVRDSAKELKEMKDEFHKLIQERERGQREFREAVKLLKCSALETMEDIEKVFTELICSLEKKRSEIKEQIRAQEKTEIDRAEELHKHLDQELTQLRKRQAEIEKRLNTDDQVIFLKSCQSVCVLPSFEDVPSFTQHTHLSFKDISIPAFKEVSEDVCQQQTARISREVSNVHVAEPPEPKTANEFLKYFCQLNLDLNTADINLKLSNRNTKASYSDKVQQYPDHPERFEFPYILCQEGLYGRCYWERLRIFEHCKEMSESAVSQYVDQFSCPVCLDPLKEPVTIPCGHSYCMSCITDCWGQKEQGPPYRCPQCRESFSQRPLLKKNTLIAEMMETLQKTSLQTAAVECDVCTTEKNRAVKSCLQCLASFCQTHLQLHYESPAFMKHKLVEASRNIQENICLSHGKLLEIYCLDDRQCICCLCTDNHKGHSVVSVDSEWTSKKKELKEIKVSCQKLIKERERGQRELSEAVKSLKSSALETMEDIEKVFTELICSLEKKRSEIKEQIRAQEKTEIDRAEELHKHLDQELTELRRRRAEIEKLLITDDQVNFLKLHLDPNTAKNHLVLLDGNKKILSTNLVQQYPDHPERFDRFPNVLCREGLCGRCYWEVECSGNDCAIAVSYKGISRKGSDDSRLGFNKESWRLSRYHQNFYFIHNKAQVSIPAVCSSRIGLYVDHRAGTLSFYSVSDTMTLLHRVQTTFTEPLYPAFGVGTSSSVRIIDQESIHANL
ncbi:E3 ubiquitin/ISG15 ligase TRIM25 [Anabarilius grahami]|uniref:E3 ubiquitin/ISG15 ligase TRIM25 n=1 Tax=Anabarilius grahami TaxID=495550 RepID=A0A3N0YUN9_ANAGA|nr:E3 ubiquitin/ISG15 ligase TRIM25 [Anabarilius grahami]